MTPLPRSAKGWRGYFDAGEGKGFLKTGAVLGAIVLLVILAIGGWQLGWWMKSSATNHISHIYGQSYGAQSADIQEVQSLVTQIDGINVQLVAPSTPVSEKAALEAQKAALVTQACSLVILITPPQPAFVSTFATANC